MVDFLVGSSFLMTIVAFVLVLIPAVIVHELGHFLAAKSVGITVLEFGIGFPPRLLRLFWWGETEFTLNWIPLGGFVRPLGEDLIRPLGEDAVERDRESLKSRLAADTINHPMQVDQDKVARPADPYRQNIEELKARGVEKFLTVNEAKPLPRILFLAAGALANFACAVGLFILIGLIGIPLPIGQPVELVQVPANSRFALAGLLPGDLIEKVNGQTFANFTELIDSLDQSSGVTSTLTIRRPATRAEFEVQLPPMSAAEGSRAEALVWVLEVAPGSPAEAAGLLADDLILSFNDQTINSTSDPTGEIQRLTEQNGGRDVALSILRNGEALTFRLTPRLNPPPGEGRIGIVIQAAFRDSRSGLIYAAGRQDVEAIVPLSVGESLRYGAEQTTWYLAQIAEVLNRIIQGTGTSEEIRPISVIGISQVGAEILQQSIQESRPVSILRFIALINILLGITNLLPLPALDGGRIVFVLLEIVRGHPMSAEREGMIHLIGLVFILSIGVLFMLNDIINPLPSILR